MNVQLKCYPKTSHFLAPFSPSAGNILRPKRFSWPVILVTFWFREPSYQLNRVWGMETNHISHLMVAHGWPTQVFVPKHFQTIAANPFIPSLLRTYPPKFGQRMAALHPRFIKSRTLWFGAALQHDDLNCGLELFKSLPWSETDWWDDAEMKSIFLYLRGAKGLCLGSLRPWFPEEI